MKIAICGAGIAGATLAHWLLKTGHEPFLIERAPTLRTGGYVMDFWGVGYTVAERMGILPAVRARGYQVERLDFVGDDGRRIGGFSVASLRSLTHGRFTSVARGDLAAEIFRSLGGRVEIVCGDTIAEIAETASGVEIALENGGRRKVDVVIGADGLNSRVRRIAFGPDADYRRDLGYCFAVFSLKVERPGDSSAYQLYSAPGRQLGRFPLRDGRTMYLFVARDVHLERDAEPRARLRALCGGMGWETPDILRRLDEAEDFYFDDVAQIRMPNWAKGRVALVGDAAAAVSFMAGEGAGLAMTEAYTLAGELARASEPAEAFAAYQRRLYGFIRGKQDAAERFAASFAPRTEFGIWLRNLASRLLVLPGAARLMLGRSLRDDFALPDLP